MPFWHHFKRKSHQKSSSAQQKNIANQKQQKNGVSIVQSDALGMMIVQENDNCQEIQSGSKEIQPLMPEQWVQILHNGSLKGYSFTRVYFSFLKGIPNYLRFKIWLFFCTQNSSKNFKFSVKNLPEDMVGKFQEQEGTAFIKITQFNTELYLNLLKMQALQKESVQIQKDIHRTYSNTSHYKYTQPILRRVLNALSNSGIQYAQGMNYILLNIIIFCLESIGVTNAQLVKAVTPTIERDILLILRQIVIRMDMVFGNNNIFQVIKELENIIAESVPQVLYHIYKLGMDCFSMFSQYYFSLMCYNDPPEVLLKQMMDLFFLVGQKAIHAIIVRMLQVCKDKILGLQSAQELQQFLKISLFKQYHEIFLKEKQKAKKLSDFGLSFYQST